ncbi:MAG TPA: hypothetical protein VJ180_14275, partial [Pyrinomonadaceae bacterium]|nr:hypothetical protein [Pyrinomonadaceae bacterium]
MNINRLLASAAFVAAISVSPVAQTRPAAPASQPPATAQPQTSGVVPDSKIALIYSNAFLDQKTGIARFNSLMTTLNREFQPRQTELSQLQQRIQTSQDEITKLQSPGSAVPVDPKSLQAKVEAL